MPKASEPPSLQLFEGLTEWGTVRLWPDHLNNTISVQLKRLGKEIVWLPLLQMCVIDGRVAMRVMAENNDRVLVYEPTTNTFSHVTGQAGLRDNPDIRNSKARQDVHGGKDNT